MKPELEQKLREGIRAADAERRAKTRGPGFSFDAFAAGPFPRDVIAKMVEAGDIDSPKQAWRTLEKWSRRGEYEYGVNLDLGWMVEAP